MPAGGNYIGNYSNSDSENCVIASYCVRGTVLCKKIHGLADFLEKCVAKNHLKSKMTMSFKGSFPLRTITSSFGTKVNKNNN